MIGTSIFMQNTGDMTYPSLTICETASGRTFADGHMFQSFAHYHAWKNGINFTLPSYNDLTEEFLGLSTSLPNMSFFTLKPDDIDDRDDIFCSQNNIYRK